MIPAPAISAVVKSLVGRTNQRPDEAKVLSACHLMQIVGPLLDATERGCTRLSNCFALLERLTMLKGDAPEPLYSVQVYEAITNLQDARTRQWPAKCERQVIVQYDVVEIEDALDTWKRLQAEAKVKVAEMDLEYPELFHEAVC